MFTALANYSKKHVVRIVFGVLLVAVFCANVLGILRIPVINRLENFTYDARVNLTSVHDLDKRIVIIDIDEKSLKEQGRWPWNRKLLAELVDDLFDEYHVKTLGFDMVFAESDESSGLKNIELIASNYLKNNNEFKQALNEIRPSLNYDQIFADHLKNRAIVLGFYFNQTNLKVDSVGQLPAPIFEKDFFQGLDIGFIQAGSYGANLALLQKNAEDGGHFNFLPDADGILRRIPMLQEYRGAQYPSLSLAILKKVLNTNDVDPEVVVDTSDRSSKSMYASIQSLKVADKRIPVDDTVSALIPFRGGRGSFAYISATDILHHRVAKDKLVNVIALVGTTAPGLMDLRASPTSSVYPGVEAHANMISGVLDNKVKQHPAFISGLEILALILIGILLTLALPKLSPVWATIFSLLILLALIFSNLFAWEYLNLVIPFASLALLTIFIFIFNMSYGFFYESRGRRQLTGIFGQYIPRELVGEMAKNPGSYSLESESRELTVLFSDVRGFTSISEGLDPKELSELMNEYLSPMTKIIHENKGTIDKYMGDAIMAFWGAPIPTENHAEIALKASMEMIRELQSINAHFIQKGWPAIDIGVGLNTGPMTVGNMGSSFRMAYTVMGDAVNLGSRLEGLTKEYGVHIIVSEFTKDQVPSFHFRELDCVRVKGKDKPVTIYEPLGLLSALTSDTLDEIAKYTSGLNAYKQQKWPLAKEIFESLKQSNDIRLYSLYMERIEHYIKEPPLKDWDGAFTFKTK